MRTRAARRRSAASAFQASRPSRARPSTAASTPSIRSASRGGCRWRLSAPCADARRVRGACRLPPCTLAAPQPPLSRTPSTARAARAPRTSLMQRTGSTARATTVATAEAMSSRTSCAMRAGVAVMRRSCLCAMAAHAQRIRIATGFQQYPVGSGSAASARRRRRNDSGRRGARASHIAPAGTPTRTWPTCVMHLFLHSPIRRLRPAHGEARGVARRKRTREHLQEL